MGLSIKDILLLDYFDGKPAHHKVPPYKESIYGHDANDRISELFDDGWIRMSRPQETLTMLPDKALSDFLKRYHLSGEGTHAELVQQDGLYRRFTAIREQAEGWRIAAE